MNFEIIRQQGEMKNAAVCSVQVLLNDPIHNLSLHIHATTVCSAHSLKIRLYIFVILFQEVD